MSRWLALAAFLVLSGCGYVGEPLPPLLNIPQPVTDLAALERGSNVVTTFTVPRLTTEGRVIGPGLHWELLAGAPGTGEFRIEEWGARARSLGEAPAVNGRVEYTFPAAPWIGKDVVLAARARGPSGRYSGWSKPLVLAVIPPLDPPRDLRAQNIADGVRLSWQGAGSAWRILRRTVDETGFAVVGAAAAPEFTDPQIEYGKTYRYVVEALAKTGAGEVESDPSPEFTFVPRDEFPPAPPAGLISVPAAASIELTWNRNIEPDLAGYRIYRALPGGQPEKIGETTEGPSYSDHKIEPGKTYRYAVSAFDRSGNESKPSAEIEVTAP